MVNYLVASYVLRYTMSNAQVVVEVRKQKAMSVNRTKWTVSTAPWKELCLIVHRPLWSWLFPSSDADFSPLMPWLLVKWSWRLNVWCNLGSVCLLAAALGGWPTGGIPGILGGLEPDEHKRNGQCLQMTFVSLSCDTYRSPMLSTWPSGAMYVSPMVVVRSFCTYLTQVAWIKYTFL